MPRQKYYEVPPPPKNPNIIKIDRVKPRIPKDLHEMATLRKAGLMGGGKKTPNPSPFVYDRGATEAETREIISGSDEMTVEEKQERILQMVEEFNQWSQREYNGRLVAARSVREKALLLRNLIGIEIGNCLKEQGGDALRGWLKELGEMGF